MKDYVYSNIKKILSEISTSNEVYLKYSRTTRVRKTGSDTYEYTFNRNICTAIVFDSNKLILVAISAVDNEEYPFMNNVYETISIPDVPDNFDLYIHLDDLDNMPPKNIWTIDGTEQNSAFNVYKNGNIYASFPIIDSEFGSGRGAAQSYMLYKKYTSIIAARYELYHDSYSDMCPKCLSKAAIVKFNRYHYDLKECVKCKKIYRTYTLNSTWQGDIVYSKSTGTMTPEKATALLQQINDEYENTNIFICSSWFYDILLNCSKTNRSYNFNTNRYFKSNT